MAESRNKATTLVGPQEPQKSTGLRLADPPLPLTHTRVNTRPLAKPTHLPHSLQDIFPPDFAGYFPEFSTLISVDKSDTKTKARAAR